MEEKDLEMSVKRFRRGENNILLATSVIEEGFDVSFCNRVIVFDPISTVKSYVQLRGRAREKNSSFAIFAEKSLKHLSKIKLEKFDLHYNEMKFASSNNFSGFKKINDWNIYKKNILDSKLKVHISNNKFAKD